MSLHNSREANTKRPILVQPIAGERLMGGVPIERGDGF